MTCSYENIVPPPAGLRATETDVAARHPKGMAKRAATHAKEVRKLNPGMRFRRSPRPAPLL